MVQAKSSIVAISDGARVFLFRASSIVIIDDCAVFETNAKPTLTRYQQRVQDFQQAHRHTQATPQTLASQADSKVSISKLTTGNVIETPPSS